MPARGRPRRTESDAEILDAARELLRTRRYGAITLDEIGRAAGVAKTTIYRRWSSKAALVAEVVKRELHAAADLTRGDLAPIIASLIGEAQENDETRAIVRELIAPYRDAIADREWVRLLVE
ncbi:MAG TPA: helix-turn-helix domain-containing protein [Thermoanaerobaculia bacterium]|nr:helix-turn-helix domain-containing protein [Thermoanaerobaculia bacterium]